MKFAEIPHRLNSLLHPPDPIVINHTITVDGPEQKKTACYDIEAEVSFTGRWLWAYLAVTSLGLTYR